jgi:hypothetical protein
LLLAAAAIAGVLFLQPSPPPFTLVEPAPVTLNPGSVQTVTIQVQRRQTGEPILLTFADLPPGVRIADATIPADATFVQVEVLAAPDTRQSGRATVRALAGGQAQQAVLELAVGEPAYVLPGHWQPDQDAEPERVGRRIYYNRINVMRDTYAVRFLLIPRDPQEKIETFYIMENKVAVALFRTYGQVPNRRENQVDQHPVFGVPVDQANGFAVALGGKLPLPEQWDKAAGRYERDHGRGPFREPVYRFVALLDNAPWAGFPANLPWGYYPEHPWGVNELAVQRTEPLPVGTATHDLSLFGCRDMAGNGLEWTRAVISQGAPARRFVPLPNPAASDSVILRGYGYKEPGPLLFEYLDKLHLVGIGEYKDPAPDYSFRVVIEP